MKRLSCEVKGQIDADEQSVRGAGSPFSQMPSLKQKAGYVQHTTHLDPNADPKVKVIEGNIVKVLWELKKSGRANDTIKNVGKCLTLLEEHTNLEDPEAVKTFVATLDRKDGYKRNLIMAYEHYVKLFNLSWTKPKYHECAKMPKIPKERVIDTIMANSPLKLRTAIAISKDTGLRPVELMRITLRNLDLQNGAIYPETAKHGSPRVLKLTNRTLNLLNQYLSARSVNLTEPIFGYWNSDTYGKWFRHYRNSLFSRDDESGISYQRNISGALISERIQKSKYSDGPEISLSDLLDTYKKLNQIVGSVGIANRILVGYATIFLMSSICRYKAEQWFKIEEDMDLKSKLEVLYHDSLYEWIPVILIQPELE